MHKVLSRTLLAVFCIAALAACEHPAPTSTETDVIIRPGSWYKTPAEGKATVMNGDTFVVKEEVVHLWGILAPEWCAPGYKESMRHLEELIEHQTISCVCDNTAPGNTTVGRWCQTATIKDVAQQMVADGYAVDWPKYSSNEYQDIQAEAVQVRRGLWASLAPWNAEQAHNACAKQANWVRPVSI